MNEQVTVQMSLPISVIDNVYLFQNLGPTHASHSLILWIFNQTSVKTKDADDCFSYHNTTILCSAQLSSKLR